MVLGNRVGVKAIHEFRAKEQPIAGPDPLSSKLDGPVRSRV